MNTTMCTALAVVASVIFAGPLKAADRKSFDPGTFETVTLMPIDSNALGALAAQQPNGELRAILEEARGGEASAALISLNGDNSPETVVQIRSATTCGIRDCETLVLRMTQAGIETIFDGNASTLGLGKVTENGWREIITNPDTKDHTGAIWQWDGTSYVLK